MSVAEIVVAEVQLYPIRHWQEQCRAARNGLDLHFLEVQIAVSFVRKGAIDVHGHCSSRGFVRKLHVEQSPNTAAKLTSHSALRRCTAFSV